MSRPFWKLPAGVSRGTWDYLQSRPIASDYDQYFTDHPLMRLDLDFIARHLPPVVPHHRPPLVADLGCGTGRVSRRLSPLGYRLVNIDLSQHMLAELQRQCQHTSDNCSILANLVELDCLQDGCLDAAVCLFSSIGMIRGRVHRRRFLTGLRRSLKPGAPLILHVHNRYQSLWDPQGPAWLLTSKWKSLTTRDWEFGDRVYAYRGLPAMFLHMFSRRELESDLRSAGWSPPRLFAINATGDALLPASWLNGWRAGGYFVIAQAG